jgi:hypothetical protein
MNRVQLALGIALLILSRFAHSCEVPGVRLPPALPIAWVTLDTEAGERAGANCGDSGISQ